MVSSGVYRRLVLLLAIVIVGIVISDILYKSEVKYKMKVAGFENRLHKLEQDGLELISLLENIKEEGSSEIDVLISAQEKKGIVIARYRNEVLDLWSDNSFELPQVYDKNTFDLPFVFFQNKWFVLGEKKIADVSYLYLIDVYHDYSIENDYIHSGYNPKLKLPAKADISMDPTTGYKVVNSNNEYLFSVSFNRSAEFNTWFFIVPFLLWCALLVIAAVLLTRLLDSFREKKNACYCVLIVVLLSMGLYFLFLLGGRPLMITNLDLFQTYRFTLGKLIPSPGHFLVITVLFIYISYSFRRWWPCKLVELSRKQKKLVLSIYLLFASLVFYLFSYFLSTIVTTSNISFEFFRILEIDYFTIVSFIAVALIPVGLVVMLNTIFRNAGDITLKELLLSASPVVIFYLLVYIIKDINPLFPLIAFLILIIIIWVFRFRKSVMVIETMVLALLLGIYSTNIISFDFRESEREKLEVFAVNQSANNDLMAESFLIEMCDELLNDTILLEKMTLDYFMEGDVNNIFKHLDTAYFKGYWEQYDIHYTVCNFDSPLELVGSEEEVNCFDFFDSMIQESGFSVLDSLVYFLDNNTGRPYYLARIVYGADSKERTGLFIELVNRIEYAQAGYPELLQNKKYYRQTQLKGYSFAKYIGDSLVMSTGIFPFDLKLEHRADSIGAFISFVENDSDCIVYSHNNNVSVVVSRPRFRFQDALINFTYIFIIFFLLLTIASVIIAPPRKLYLGGFDFRQKLQYSFTLVMLGSIVGIGSVVVSLSINQFRQKHFDNISEKLGSVSIELDHKLSNEEELSFDWHQDAYENLDALLIKFSNVFKTDINLYSTDGLLLATSRREMFDRNLMSRRMDYKSFAEMRYFGSSQYIFEDKAGDLTYLSAYTPFLNYRNEVLAYLNLPYFAVQDQLSEEVSNLIVAIVNFSLILIVISIAIIIIIAVQITSPLRMLIEGMASVSLDGDTKRLEYSGQDEIAELVEQYNNMLGQLRESALKLARSEREDAWRDMAKQIAHEIKNPLTPMKLNVQQLQKSWQDSSDGFDKRIVRFSENMIENIDNLSSIATEFSNFARMPQANLREIDLVSKISSSAELYKNMKNVELKLSCSDLKRVIILGDREQVNMMLTNVVRNAVQSIPSNRKGIVEVGLRVKDDRVIISVTDNGVGIPSELGDKLFIPNFTTKSSGMGIGLAIVKRIVETAGGKVYYKSELDKGTTFYIDFPLITAERN